MALDMPTRPGFISSTFELESNTIIYESPLSKSIQRDLKPGTRWRATYTLPAMTRQQASLWIAFMAKLEGMTNTFNAFDPEGKIPLGIATGVPLVNGASQTGKSLITDGWTPNVFGILKAGDYFSVNTELKLITDNINTDGSGNATLTFEPALRNSPANNAPLTVINTTVEMILTSNAMAGWTTNENGIYQSKSFSAVEALS